MVLFIDLLLYTGRQSGGSRGAISALAMDGRSPDGEIAFNRDKDSRR